MDQAGVLEGISINLKIQGHIQPEMVTLFFLVFQVKQSRAKKVHIIFLAQKLKNVHVRRPMRRRKNCLFSLGWGYLSWGLHVFQVKEYFFSSQAWWLILVIIAEVGSSWFKGILGYFINNFVWKWNNKM